MEGSPSAAERVPSTARRPSWASLGLPRQLACPEARGALRRLMVGTGQLSRSRERPRGAPWTQDAARPFLPSQTLPLPLGRASGGQTFSHSENQTQRQVPSVGTVQARVVVGVGVGGLE